MEIYCRILRLLLQKLQILFLWKYIDEDVSILCKIVSEIPAKLQI